MTKSYEAFTFFLIILMVSISPLKQDFEIPSMLYYFLLLRNYSYIIPWGWHIGTKRKNLIDLDLLAFNLFWQIQMLNRMTFFFWKNSLTLFLLIENWGVILIWCFYPLLNHQVLPNENKYLHFGFNMKKFYQYPIEFPTPIMFLCLINSVDIPRLEHPQVRWSK